MGFDFWCFSFQGRRSPGFSCVQLSEDASLRYIHSSETLTLTLNHTAEHLLEADIKLFRKYFWDRAFLIKVCALYYGIRYNNSCFLRVQTANSLSGEQYFFFFFLRGSTLFFSNETWRDMALETVTPVE